MTRVRTLANILLEVVDCRTQLRYRRMSAANLFTPRQQPGETVKKTQVLGRTKQGQVISLPMEIHQIVA
jgi:hypothetical protein